MLYNPSPGIKGNIPGITNIIAGNFIFLAKISLRREINVAARKLDKIEFFVKLNNMIYTVQPIAPIIPAGKSDFFGELKKIENPTVAKKEKKKLMLFMNIKMGG